MLVLTHAVHIALNLWWLLFVIEYECLFLYSHSVISSICLHSECCQSTPTQPVSGSTLCCHSACQCQDDTNCRQSKIASTMPATNDPQLRLASLWIINTTTGQ
ncbi:hypothetical protein EDD86DRAFT_89293 [Gorgonomyces haynaldii]|nr:hypothetical protein EDD86DRAFT_89293 [Gorgonomyces haynaldii]